MTLFDSTPPGPPTVSSIPTALAAEIVIERHYLHRRPPISYAYGLRRGFGEPVAVVTYGIPASRQAQMSVCPTDPDLAIELNRLWIDDNEPRNTASWFVSRSLKLLPPRIVFSYADSAHGHAGYVYRAMNFTYAGWTDMDRKTARVDYLPASGGHSRDATRSGVVGTRPRRPKAKYWTTTGNRTDRRRLTALCGWPPLSWKEHPPPTEHQTIK